MQKKRKIIISIAISLGLALAATQISNNGGLQSSILAPLQSCKNSTITSLERCKTPLTTEKTRIQKEIDALDKKIASKKTECIKLIGVPNRSTQLTTCRAQLKVLERDKVKQVAAMKPIDLAISKLVSEIPLQTKLAAAQKEFDAIKAQATAKVSECNSLRTQNKTAQAATCNQQLVVLRQTQTAKQTALINATNALQKVAGVTTPLVPTQPSTPVTVPVSVSTKPIPPIVTTPTLLHCCADNKAKNFNSTCGIAPNTYSNPALCVYPTNPGCTDSTALNYDAAYDVNDGSCKYGSLLCMDSLALNFMSPLPCTYFQERPGCNDREANNYNSNATVNDGSCTYDPIPACNGEGDHGYDSASRTCMTCSDGKQNGDESDIDCGGKCGDCRVGCKDQKANNYNGDPKVKDGGPGACSYDIELSTNPQPYCDVPGALNYEKHEGDTGYVGQASSCNFCGNETREGIVLPDGTTEPETLTGDGGSTVKVAEECEDGPDDKQYDGCYQCRLETCGDELALCRQIRQQYKLTGYDEVSTLTSAFSGGLTGNPASKRPDWTNYKLDAVNTKGRDFVTLGPICLRDKDKKIVSYIGRWTIFGLDENASTDMDDPGFGSPTFGNLCSACTIANITSQLLTTGPAPLRGGATPTNNTIIRGVAIPTMMLREIFGTDVNYRRVRVDVTGPNGCFRYPIVDDGPHEYTWTRKCSAVLDMTYAAVYELGLQGKHDAQIKWTIRANAGEDASTRLTPTEINAGFTTSTFSNTYGFNYRQYTQIEYPNDFFTPTRCN